MMALTCPICLTFVAAFVLASTRALKPTAFVSSGEYDTYFDDSFALVISLPSLRIQGDGFYAAGVGNSADFVL